MTVCNPRNRQAWRKTPKEGLLIGYFVAGDPELDATIDIVKQAFMAGLDIAEIGVPSMDPYLDGDIIRRGHERVSDDMKERQKRYLSFWEKLREEVDHPLWAMGYYKDLVDTGLYRELVRHGYIDSLLIPDAPSSFLSSHRDELERDGVDGVAFLPSDSTEEAIAQVGREANIIYAQTHKGATGNAQAALTGLRDVQQRIRNHTDTMVVAGFGISNPEKVRGVMQAGFDGAVVGSAFMARWERNEEDSLYKLIADMKMATIRGQISGR